MITDRHIILGASGSGKTYYKDELLEDKYSHCKWYHFGNTLPAKDYKKYEMVIKTTKIRETIPLLLELCLRRAREEGTEFVFIFDDVLIPKITQSDELAELFATGRHGNIHIIFLCQTATKSVASIFYNNMTEITLFKMMNYKQIRGIFRSYLNEDLYQQYIDEVAGRDDPHAKITFNLANPLTFNPNESKR